MAALEFYSGTPSKKMLVYSMHWGKATTSSETVDIATTALRNINEQSKSLQRQRNYSQL